IAQIRAVALVEFVVKPEGNGGHHVEGGVYGRQVAVGDDATAVGGQHRVIGVLGLRRNVEDHLHGRRQPADRNLIVSKRRATVGVGYAGAIAIGIIAGGRRIIDGLRNAGAVGVPAKVALTLLIVRHVDDFVGGVGQRVALIREEPEALVSAVINVRQDDGATSGGAELVAHQVRRGVDRRIVAVLGDADGVVARSFKS